MGPKATIGLINVKAIHKENIVFFLPKASPFSMLLIFLPIPHSPTLKQINPITAIDKAIKTNSVHGALVSKRIK